MEKAARAAGYSVRWHANSYYGRTMEIMETEEGGPPWNPLTDDGDALRLAVALEMDVMQRRSDPEVWVQAPMLPTVREAFGADRQAATRRAIVRAAAALGDTE